MKKVFNTKPKSIETEPVFEEDESHSIFIRDFKPDTLVINCKSVALKVSQCCSVTLDREEIEKFNYIEIDGIRFKKEVVSR